MPMRVAMLGKALKEKTRWHSLVYLKYKIDH